MIRSKYYYNLLELNFAVFLMSTSGVLGRYIDIPVPLIICSRAVLAALLLYLYNKYRRNSISIVHKDLFILLIGGVLLGLHWITYFYSLKLSSVALGMLSIYTFPVITSILEPIFLKTKFQKPHLLMGMMILFGMYLLVPEFNFKSDSFIGICLGVLSAILYSIRNILLKPQIKNYQQSVLMYYQLVVVAIFLSPVYFIYETNGILEFLPSIILLSVATTALGHTLFVNSLKTFSASSASLISSLQPIYGIILGFIILQEIPNAYTIVGGIIILSTVVVEGYRVKNTLEIKT